MTLPIIFPNTRHFSISIFSWEYVVLYSFILYLMAFYNQLVSECFLFSWVFNFSNHLTNFQSNYIQSCWFNRVSVSVSNLDHMKVSYSNIPWLESYWLKHIDLELLNVDLLHIYIDMFDASVKWFLFPA